jgi:alpha-1,3-rhamnosyl/mannosyltransferase
MPYVPGLPTVLTVYDFIPLVCPQYYTATQRLIYRLAHLLALRCASAVLAISAATRADISRYFRVDPDRVTVTPLAAGPQFTPQPAAAVDAARRKHGLPERYTLFLASNKPHKNLLRLVEAWPEVLRRHPNTHLVVAGHWDPRFPQPRQRSAALGLETAVHFAGPLPEADLPAVYSGADLFVFPSAYEGFGLPVLEALACGTPVVCSNTSSLPEVAGDAACLVDPSRAGELADAISLVLADAERRADMRRRGLAQANRFSWEQTALATCDVYRGVASTR